MRIGSRYSKNLFAKMDKVLTYHVFIRHGGGIPPKRQRTFHDPSREQRCSADPIRLCLLSFIPSSNHNTIGTTLDAMADG